MSAYDLTNLAALKFWLGLPSGVSPSDATLGALITASSRAIYAWLSRPSLLPTSVSETLDSGDTRLYLRNWPVLSIASVTLDGIAIPAATPGPALAGYLLQPAEPAPPGRPQALDIFGYRLLRARQNLIIAYTAGYAVQGEAQIVPSAPPLQIAAIAPYGPWASNVRVVYAASGVVLTPVATPAGPGQYSFASGVYSFSLADAGASLLLSYGFAPQDLAQAALELAAERFRAAERIGLRSKSIGGQETISYDISAISAPILALLQPYRRVAI